MARHRSRPPQPHAHRGRSVALACLLACAGSALAQSGNGLRITPTLSGEVSLINRSGAAPGGASGLDVVTRVGPGLEISSRAGKVRGTLSYQLDAVHHSNAPTDDTQNLQNRLSAALNAELIDNFFYVDANANISQVADSAFGVQTVNSSVANGNRTEVGTLSVIPRLQGNVGGVAVYSLSFPASVVNGRRSTNADYNSLGAVLSLGSPRGGTTVGWGLQASSQETDFRAGRKTRNDRYSLSVYARIDTDLTLTLRGGQEATNVIGITRQSYNNYGAELLWTPSPRTTVNLSTDERYFGNSRQILVEHRFRRSSLRFTSIRGASGGDGFDNATGAGVGQPVSLYALFFNQFASIEPDPVLREQLVRNFLRAQGLDPNTVVGGGFINSAISLQRRDDLAYSWTGVRNTFSLLAFRSKTDLLDQAGQSQNPSNGLGIGGIKQHGFTATLSHRLTPTASASASASLLRTGSSGAQEGNDLRSLSLSVSEQLTRMISASLSARYSDFNSATQPYRESALTASFNVRF